MNKRLGYQIYYADGSVSVGKNLLDWISLPHDGVLVVIEVYAATVGRKIHTTKSHAGRDYYWFCWDGLTMGSGCASQIPDNAHLKAGQLVEREDFVRIYNTATAVIPIGEFGV